MTATRRLSILLISLLTGCQANRLAQLAPPGPAEQRLDSGFATTAPPYPANAATGPALGRRPAANAAPAAYVQPAAYLQPAANQPATHPPPASPAFYPPTGLIQPAERPSLPEPLAPPVPAGAADSELSLSQLEHMAIAGNPSVAEAYALVEAARGKWVQVGLPPNTVMGYSGQQLGSGGIAEQQGLFVGQEFIRGHKLQLNRAVVSQEIQKAEQLLAAQQQRVLTDVRLAYYEVLVAQRRNETADELVKIAQQALETAEALLQAKEVSQIDVMRARIELQTTQLLLKNAWNLHAAAWSRLQAVVGDPELQPRRLTGTIEGIGNGLDAGRMLARLVAESPEMAAAMTEVERARWAVDRANADPVPNVDVQAVVQNDNATGSGNANLLVTLPIPWLDRNQGGIRRAQAEVIAAERAIDRLELSLHQQFATVFQHYANARNQVVDYSKPGGILANSKATLETVGSGYEAGELSYLDLITAQRTFSRTNLAYIEALGELWAAYIEIDGLLLKGSLDSNRAALPRPAETTPNLAPRPVEW